MREEAGDGYAREDVLLEPGEAPELDVYHLPDFQRQRREERGGFLHVGRSREGFSVRTSPLRVVPLPGLGRLSRGYVILRSHGTGLTIFAQAWVVIPTGGSASIFKEA
jgi:hypothetical protein